MQSSQPADNDKNQPDQLVVYQNKVYVGMPMIADDVKKWKIWKFKARAKSGGEILDDHEVTLIPEPIAD